MSLGSVCHVSCQDGVRSLSCRPFGQKTRDANVALTIRSFLRWRSRSPRRLDPLAGLPRKFRAFAWDLPNRTYASDFTFRSKDCSGGSFQRKSLVSRCVLAWCGGWIGYRCDQHAGVHPQTGSLYVR